MPDTAFRPLDPGQGEAIFRRTYQRSVEDWGGASDRVSFGNVSLVDPNPHTNVEYHRMRAAMRRGVLPMSGRHLQQGDAQQATRPMEVFTNCSTAPWTWGKFYLLLNGSGVGRYYANALAVVDWRNMPDVALVIGKVPEGYTGAHLTPGEYHPEYLKARSQGFHNRDTFLRDLDSDSRRESHRPHYLFTVPDSREGWAQAVEMLESMAFDGSYKNHLVILDFSEVRPEGAPIGGMQDRPASGPLPLMHAIQDIYRLKSGSMKPWKQAMYTDHYTARTVQVGGARRAARIAVKPWTDPLEDVLEFITIKRDDNLAGGDGLWSSNNSVGVDAEFWHLVRSAGAKLADRYGVSAAVVLSRKEKKAWSIFEAASRAAYEHGNGEPGWLNLDKLHQDDTGLEVYDDGIFAQSDRYTPLPMTGKLSGALVDAVKGLQYKYIVNPCGEISLFVLGGFCVIADVVPFHADTLEEAEEALRLATRALMRVNLMESLYSKEVHRTNRIGVGLTGIFEFAWKFFGLTFRDLIEDYDRLLEVAGWMDNDAWADVHKLSLKALPFWKWLYHARSLVVQTATEYAAELGVPVPHTMLTVKPSGTVSKLWGITEGLHLSAFKEYLRWVQFDKLAQADTIMEYEAKGYPVKWDLINAQGVNVYPSVAVVGFPTRPLIRTLGIPEERFVTASEVSFEEHFKWVSLVERFWLGEEYGNQVSYTAKFDKRNTSYEEYTRVISTWMPEVKAIAVLATDDYAATEAIFGYAPEQSISAEEYEALVQVITQMEETITDDDIRCLGGACPIL